MTEAFSHISPLAVIAATVAHFVLGGVWFGALFAKPYARALGIEDRPESRPAPIFLIGPLVCGAVTSLTTALLLKALGVDDYPRAIVLGAVVGIGYIGATTVNIAINPLFPHPLRYALVNVPMFVIGSVMVSTILVAFG